MTFRPRHIRRLLQALLACVAVMVVVAPEIGTAAAHETSTLAAGSPGSPPRMESSASVLQVGPQHLEPTFVVGLERTHLDLPFFTGRPPEPLFDLLPRRVIENLTVHPVHARRVAEANLAYAIDVMENRGRICILDGIHRLAKTAQAETARVSVRRIPRTAIPSIRR